MKRYNVKTGNETVVGTFPAKDVKWAGYDSIFQFKADASEVHRTRYVYPASDVYPACV